VPKVFPKFSKNFRQSRKRLPGKASPAGLMPSVAAISNIFSIVMLQVMRHLSSKKSVYRHIFILGMLIGTCGDEIAVVVAAKGRYGFVGGDVDVFIVQVCC